MASGDVNRPTPTTGLPVSLPDPVCKGLLIAFAGESRGLRIHVPGRDVYIPQVGQIGEQGHDFAGLGLVYACDAEKLFGCETQRDGAFVADCILRVLDQLAQQPDAVLKRTAIFVGALIAPLLQEVHRKRQIMRCVDIHDVEPGSSRAQGGLAMPATIVADVAQRHRTRLVRIAVLERLMRRRERHFARIEVRGGRSVVRQLDGRESAVRMHLVAHERERGNVLIVPQPRLHIGRHIAARMDLAFLRADHGPAALCFHFAHGRMRLGHRIPHAVAVRDLVEAILRRHRTDANGFEENVVAGRAHGGRCDVVSRESWIRTDRRGQAPLLCAQRTTDNESTNHGSARWRDRSALRRFRAADAISFRSTPASPAAKSAMLHQNASRPRRTASRANRSRPALRRRATLPSLRPCRPRSPRQRKLERRQ